MSSSPFCEMPAVDPPVYYEFIEIRMPVRFEKKCVAFCGQPTTISDCFEGI